MKHTPWKPVESGNAWTVEDACGVVVGVDFTYEQAKLTSDAVNRDHLFSELVEIVERYQQDICDDHCEAEENRHCHECLGAQSLLHRAEESA